MITHIFEKELAATNMTEREGLAHFILMQYLKSLGIEKHQAQGISGILRTEENITQMNWWIHDNRARGISREESIMSYFTLRINSFTVIPYFIL